MLEGLGPQILVPPLPPLPICPGLIQALDAPCHVAASLIIPVDVGGLEHLTIYHRLPRGDHCVLGDHPLHGFLGVPPDGGARKGSLRIHRPAVPVELPFPPKPSYDTGPLPPRRAVFEIFWPDEQLMMLIATRTLTKKKAVSSFRVGEAGLTRHMVKVRWACKKVSLE